MVRKYPGIQSIKNIVAHYRKLDPQKSKSPSRKLKKDIIMTLSNSERGFRSINKNKSILINTNKLNIDPTGMSLLTGVDSTRTTIYSSVITCQFQYALTDFPEARYFWNSGGAINVSGTILGYSTGTGWDGSGIDEILTAMGTVTMNYTETIQSGSGGTPTSRGFYDLTASPQTIFSQDGTGVYSDANITIYAFRSEGGKTVTIQVNITPESGKDVDGTTTITSQYRKLNNQSSGAKSLTIAAPIPTVVDELED